MNNTETITESLKRRLREVGAANWDSIAQQSGVTGSFIRKFVYGSRENPRVQTIQPLIDFFGEMDRQQSAIDQSASGADRTS